MDLQLAGRVVALTGAARGLGFATAKVLVEEGANVVLSGRSSASLGRAVEELGPERAAAVVADNADPRTPPQIIEAAKTRFGRLDAALISVGGPPSGSILDITDEQWTTAYASVFLGAVRLCREVGSALPSGGSLALVLSTSVKAPIPGLATSNGLRPGLAMLAKELADELGPRGVRVNGLMPGRVETERIAELDSLADDPVAARSEHEARIPLRRYGTPAEFGRVAAFLLSPASSFVTGAMVPVDGGMLRSL